jgi:sphinganine-1-phosphate aldolase
MLDFVMNRLSWLPPRVGRALEKRLRTIPFVRRQLEHQYAAILGDLEGSLKPYRDQFVTYRQLPERGVPHEEVIGMMEALRTREAAQWETGHASGAVYHGARTHIDYLNRIYALHSQSNPLHADIWPSVTKFEAEMVAMTADMLGAGQTTDEVVGVVTSGGTESILLAMKTYRDRARGTQGITAPEMVTSTTAHAAFGIKHVHVPVSSDYRADVAATRQAITKNTVVIVGSAPSYPHGVIDPIPELSAIAHERGIGFHTDACLGGFLLPWAVKLGYEVPAFDFRLPGVTSMSADTHKYGYAAKGTSVVLYRTRELRRYQYFTATDWPGGLYFSPTLAGSRPGALSAAGWAAMVALGEEGYLEAARRILETAATIRAGIEAMPELHVLGDPLWVIAFTAWDIDIYRIMDYMTRRGWSLNGLHKPRAVHICVTLPHTQPGVAEQFLADLRSAVDFVQQNPDAQDGMAPVYGMAASVPFRGLVDNLLKRYIDLLYEP